MAQILTGKEPVISLEKASLQLIKGFYSRNIHPCLALVRVGDNPDDIFYQHSIEKVCGKLGIEVKIISLKEDIGNELLQKELTSLSANSLIHGILLFCPLSQKYDEKAARACISPNKDIDCLTLQNAGLLYTGEDKSFAPCTPRAVMELLKYYNIPTEGKNVVILGRSLVVGKPLSLLLLKTNATVTICHSHTQNLTRVCREADILIAAIGKPRFVTKEFMKAGQIIIDVGINEDPLNPGKYCGDVNFEDAQEIVAAATPVPGGIGALTTQVLCHHTLEACAWANPQ